MSFSQFVKPYLDGYEDFESGGTPVTAAILNTNYDGFLLALNEFLPELEGMVEANPSEAATAGDLTKLKVGNSIYLIPSGGSGGSTVEWEQLQLTGTKIATITIDNVPVDVYAPSGGGSGDEVSWTQVLGSGTEIGTITINDTPITVYAPTPIDVEANPSGSATAGDLTKLKVGSSIYSIPSGGSGGASDLSDLGDVTITNVQDGQILKWNSTTSKWENVNDASGGSGHTILDDDGTALSQEDDLQFKGVYTADNSTDGVTEVNVYREMTKSEFNLLSSDEKKGFIRTTDEPDIYSDGHFQPVIYSFEEREIGVWTDGKPLYQKTVHISNVQFNSTGVYDLDLTSMGTDVLIADNSCSYYTFSTYVRNFEKLVPEDEHIYCYGVANRPIADGYITIKYTKTSDVAGSGDWTPQGVPTHHYSTDEHIVGTYFGETLYEKTIQTTFTATVKINNAFYLGDTPIVGLSNIVDKYMITNFMTNTTHKIFSIIYDKANDCFTISNLDNVTTAIPIDITIQYTKSS